MNTLFKSMLLLALAFVVSAQEDVDQLPEIIAVPAPRFVDPNPCLTYGAFAALAGAKCNMYCIFLGNNAGGYCENRSCLCSVGVGSSF